MNNRERRHMSLPAFATMVFLTFVAVILLVGYLVVSKIEMIHKDGNLRMIAFSFVDEVNIIRSDGSVNVGLFWKAGHPEILFTKDLSFTSPAAEETFKEFHRTTLCYHPGMGFPDCSVVEKGDHGMVQVFYRDWYDLSLDPPFDPIVGIAEDGQWLWRDEEYLPDIHPFVLALVAKSDNGPTSTAQLMSGLIRGELELCMIAFWKVFFHITVYVLDNLPPNVLGVW